MISDSGNDGKRIFEESIFDRVDQANDLNASNIVEICERSQQ